MRTLAALTLLLAALGCSRDTAQHAHARPIDVTPAHVQSQALESQDRDFLEKASTGGNAEVAIGSLVDGRALRPEVVAFGHMMVADHTNANKQLIAIAAAKRVAVTKSLGEHQAAFDRVVDEKLDQFDRDFVRVMIEDHQQAVDLFTAEAKNGTDPQLKAFAAATLPVIQSHLQHIQSMSALAMAVQPTTLEQPPETTVTTATAPLAGTDTSTTQR
ncbi:MAG TPA: DUF4142 domain-containing protein [Thermoanaerobaculia bacterium]|jgi:putative membrane protein